MNNIEWLKNFIAVYRSGSVSGAAEMRHLTQPAVSQQLASLESYLGNSLFRRTPRGMIPTEQGKALYTQVYESLDKLERVGRSLRKYAETMSSVIRLGTSPEYFHSFALERLSGSDLRLQVSFADAKELLSQLEMGLLDAVIGAHRPTSRGLEYHILAEKQFSLIVPKGAKLPSKARRNAWIAAQPWVVYSPELPLVRRFWQQTFAKPFDGKVTLTVPDLRTVLRAVELGWGISILPNFLIDKAVQQGSLQSLSLDDVISSERWLLIFRNIDSDKTELHKLEQLLKEK